MNVNVDDPELGWDRALGSVITVAGVAVVSRAKLQEGAEAKAAGASSSSLRAGSGGGGGGGGGKSGRGGGDGDDGRVSTRTSIDGIDVVVNLGHDHHHHRGGVSVGGGGVGSGEALLNVGAVAGGRASFREVEMTEVPSNDDDGERDEAPLLGASILQSLPRDPPTPLRSLNR